MPNYLPVKRFLPIIAAALLAACGPAVAENPPLPTIVAVTPTPEPPTNTPPLPPTDTPPPAPQPTVTPAATSAERAADTLPEPTPTEPPPPPSATPTLPPPPTDTPPPAGPPPLESLRVGLLPVASGFESPVHVTHAGDGSGRLFVVEQPGRIRLVANGAVNPVPFLDITAIVGSSANEQGLLSVAFHPDYAQNGRFFVNYTNRQGDTVLARYRVSDNPDVADPDSAVILLTIGQPYANHNGGHILFGPDGYLYVGMGDGGAANDPENRAQNPAVLLGKILRLDVDNAEPYGAPPSNPFVGAADARPEIWSLGWRNPWRLAFDSQTGDLYVGDVGQNTYEEISFEPAGSAGGLNYGWRLMEGRHCFNPSTCDPAALPVVLPVAEYDHGQGCSVTGGEVYRGGEYPALNGVYFYGDYCRGTVWGLRRLPDGNWAQAELLQSGAAISSFGRDESGEVYLVDHAGAVFELAVQP